MTDVQVQPTAMPPAPAPRGGGMLDIQRRHKEVFRIRFGDKTEKGAPRRLVNSIRVTSERPDIIDEFVAVYGGERRPWDGDKWEVYLPTNAMKILLVPGQSISQAWEMYKGNVCERRCDGYIEQKSGKPCDQLRPMCPRDVEARRDSPAACAPTTRVSVMCPDVKVAGVGMFVTRGLLAAETLPQSIGVAEAALRFGWYVPATLQVQEMVGKGRKYIVPVISISGVSLEQMIDAANTAHELGGSAAGQILGGTAAVAAIATPRPPTVRDQFEQNALPAAPNTRKNAAEPIPPTGIEPRTAAETGGVDEIADAEIVGDEPPATSSPHAEDPPGRSGSGGSPVNRVAIAAREAGLDDAGRHDLAEWASIGRVRSSVQLTEGEAAHAIDAARKIKEGSHRLERREDGLVLVDNRFGFAQADPNSSSDVVDGDSGGLSYDEITRMKAPALKAALEARGTFKGGTVAEMRAQLIAECGYTGEEPF